MCHTIKASLMMFVSMYTYVVYQFGTKAVYNAWPVMLLRPHHFPYYPLSPGKRLSKVYQSFKYKHGRRGGFNLVPKKN